LEELLGVPLGVFLGLTVGVMGFAAYATGQALANIWKPAWHAVIYALLLGFGDRFLTFALFEGKLLSLSAYLMDTAVLVLITLLSYRLSLARKMVRQYPWLYRRTGPFSWRRKQGA
jgi:Na+/H+ antiporter NhaA